jgi:large subunit ribosomal protein L1
MAKKADLLAQAKDLGLAVTEKNTIAQIEEAIKKSEHTETVAETVTEEKPTTKVETTDKNVTEEEAITEKFAKAGKRSHKAVTEAEEEAARQARKEEGAATEEKKGPKPIVRSRLERRGKKYRELAKKIETGKSFSLAEAVKLASETSPVKFDATVEIHVRLDVDPKQANQNIRATVTLPSGTGKTVRVAAFVPKEQGAGADIAGEEEVLALLDKEQLDFDVLVTTPQLMPKLGKYARLLGPKGLMPNPKAGTVSADPAKAIEEARAGKIEYRVDKQSIVHLGIGKVSFGAEKLLANANVFFESLNANKPTGLKGNYIITVSVTTSMGPGIKVDLSSLTN